MSLWLANPAFRKAFRRTASPYLRSSCPVSPRSGIAREAAPARIGTVNCKDTSRCEKCVDLSSISSYIVLARGYRSL
jgi:hypothetical protein